MSELIDNRAHRISVLKEIIQHLHAGAAPELVKERLRKIVGELTPEHRPASRATGGETASAMQLRRHK